ncbi:chymotrypsin-elastase inhibitor ixodidin-like [Aethina tumida]|uniref:chymotrypsin-elastase inhibitor ixodidin-like n=1 Tax=Aethina tumida TaxID=116153 RepID=UPI002147B3D0|nr:chymotrypsin-elastase inhibitor ixodidin-like [Aethina tumida]
MWFKIVIHVLLIRLSISNWDCDDREVFRICPGCPGYCQNRFPNRCIFPCIPGCTCLPGYLRDVNTGYCVPRDSCLQHSPHMYNHHHHHNHDDTIVTY